MEHSPLGWSTHPWAEALTSDLSTWSQEILIPEVTSPIVLPLKLVTDWNISVLVSFILLQQSTTDLVIMEVQLALGSE